MTKLSKKFEQRIILSKQCYEDYAIFGYKQLYDHLEEIKKLENELDNLTSSSRIIDSVYDTTDCGKDGIKVHCKYCGQVKKTI